MWLIRSPNYLAMLLCSGKTIFRNYSRWWENAGVWLGKCWTHALFPSNPTFVKSGFRLETAGGALTDRTAWTSPWRPSSRVSSCTESPSCVCHA
jgi:hypothetical protein